MRSAALQAEAPTLDLSPFQERVCAIPEAYDVFLGGGRGGAKSRSMAVLVLRHGEQYGQRARTLFIRRSYKGLADFENECRETFLPVYRTAARYNASEHVWRFPTGAYLELGQLDGPDDYAKYQGRSFTLLLVDEAGQYPDPTMLDKLRSNLRGPRGMPIREVKAANPGDPGHHWLAQRYVFRAAPWAPFYESKSKRQWVNAPSTYRDNPFIDHAEYRAQLEASCPTDPELLRAWLDGDWTVARGAFFAGLITESRNCVDPWSEIAWTQRGAGLNEREVFLAHDYGSAAPSVTFVCVRSPGAEGPDGRWYPRDSLVLVDELATNVPGQLNAGMGYTVPRLAEEIRDLCRRWQIKADGVADDAIFAKHGSQSIAEEFRRSAVVFRPARKGDRKTGWEIMRRMLADADKPDVPGLYVSRACEYFWATVPYLGRDPRRADDVDTRAADHAADAARYACLGYVRGLGGVHKIRGMY